ncbi:MAG: hypothetical protein WA702_00540 [Bradyrhizobium sp.]|uniref:hypothetical protein n=1 Tax=Bradyrhizobium sp. TaxID=376 RepID=UPI003C7ADB47
MSTILMISPAAESFHPQLAPFAAEGTMGKLIVLLAIILGCAGAVFYDAHDAASKGVNWAVLTCSKSKAFCQHPAYLFYGCGGMLIVALGYLLGSTLSGDISSGRRRSQI